MASRRLVLNVGRGDGDPTLFFFWRLVNLIERNKIRHPLQTAQLRDRSRQRRLPMVNVTDGPYVYVRLRPLKFFLRHFKTSLNGQLLAVSIFLRNGQKGGAHDRN
jgi:hypothetical protein